MPRFSDIKRAILRYCIKNLVADASRLDMGHIIERIAFFLIALGLNCIFPSPVAFFSVTVLGILWWECMYLLEMYETSPYVREWTGHMSHDAAYVELALYFCYLIATIVGEWIQKKKLIRENRRLTQENGELVRVNEQLVQDEEQLVQDEEQLAQDEEQLQHAPLQLGTALLAKLQAPGSIKLSILQALIILSAVWGISTANFIGIIVAVLYTATVSLSSRAADTIEINQTDQH
jgi:hypothetical protein